MGRLGVVVSFFSFTTKLFNVSLFLSYIFAFDQTGKKDKEKKTCHKNQLGQHENIDDFIYSANAHAQIPYILC